jgi:hypothetical protein
VDSRQQELDARRIIRRANKEIAELQLLLGLLRTDDATDGTTGGSSIDAANSGEPRGPVGLGSLGQETGSNQAADAEPPELARAQARQSRLLRAEQQRQERAQAAAAAAQKEAASRARRAAALAKLQAAQQRVPLHGTARMRPERQQQLQPPVKPPPVQPPPSQMGPPEAK